MSRTNRWRILALAACAWCVAPNGAAAQQTAASAAAPRSNTRNLMLGFALTGASLNSQDLEDESASGGGLNAQLGFGFTRLFTLLINASGAELDPDQGAHFTLVHFDVLARFNFGKPTRAWVPYVEGGFSGRVAGQDDAGVIEPGGNHREVDLEISGGGFTVGGGVNYYVAPTLALGAGLLITSGEFSTVKFNNISVDGFELDATSTRLNFGLTWYPMRRPR